jgi:hypothetical protein
MFYARSGNMIAIDRPAGDWVGWLDPCQSISVRGPENSRHWTHIAPQIQTAICYLNVTSSARQWIANPYNNVFRAERQVRLSGPQMSPPP